MNAGDLIRIAVGDVLFFALGVLVRTWWINDHHECMPHEPGIGCTETSDKKRRARAHKEAKSA